MIRTELLTNSGGTYPNGDYPNGSGSGYTCQGCGLWIGMWQFHQCQPKTYPTVQPYITPPAPWDPKPVPVPQPISDEDVERIAKRVLELLLGKPEE